MQLKEKKRQAAVEVRIIPCRLRTIVEMAAPLTVLINRDDLLITIPNQQYFWFQVKSQNQIDSAYLQIHLGKCAPSMCHRRELPVLRYHRIMVINPYWGQHSW